MIYRNTLHKTFACGGGFKTSVYSGNTGNTIFKTEIFGTIDEAEADAKAWVDSISDPIDFSGLKPILDTELSEEAKNYFKFLFPDSHVVSEPIKIAKFTIVAASIEDIVDSLNSIRFPFKHKIGKFEFTEIPQQADEPLDIHQQQEVEWQDRKKRDAIESILNKLDSMDAHPLIEWAENLRGWNNATDELRSFLKTL